eukprot:scaffold84830_cov64-Phaeocystis_antarctica.AAC.3
MRGDAASSAWGLRPLTAVVDAVLGPAVTVDEDHLRLPPQLAVAAHLGHGGQHVGAERVAAQRELPRLD